MNTSLAAELYNSRFIQFGKDIKTVGWGSHQDQKLRFDVLFRGLDPIGKTILDVGCGLADLVPYLENITDGNFAYIGIDVAEKLIEEAKKTYNKSNILFFTGDIFSVELPLVDICVLSGALSYKVDGIESYAKETMKKMFQLSKEVSSFNFLSSYVDFELEKNQHYSPESVFKEAKLLSPKVNLYHDYPLYEFTVQIIKPN